MTLWRRAPTLISDSDAKILDSSIPGTTSQLTSPRKMSRSLRKYSITMIRPKLECCFLMIWNCCWAKMASLLAKKQFTRPLLSTIWKKMVAYHSISSWRPWQANLGTKSTIEACTVCSKSMTEKERDLSLSRTWRKCRGYWDKTMMTRCCIWWSRGQVRLRSSRSHINNFTNWWPKQSIDALQFMHLSIKNINCDLWYLCSSSEPNIASFHPLVAYFLILILLLQPIIQLFFVLLWLNEEVEAVSHWNSWFIFLYW